MDSPFQHVIHTNYTPNATESAQIVEFCSVPEAEIKRLNTEIAKLQEALNTLTSQRDKIQEVVDSHRALLSPIRRIPPEVLQLIFGFCLDSRRNPVMHHCEAPLLLGRICSKWREIAMMKTPELWSSIHIAVPPLQRLLRLDPVHVVEWLNRSGKTRPLDISIYTPQAREPSAVAAPFISYLRVILSYASRWRTLRLHMPQAAIKALEYLQIKDTPLLEDVFIHGVDSLPPFPIVVNRLTFLASAPNLYRLSCVVYPLWLPPPHHLVELSLEQIDMEYSNLLFILNHCTRLQKCTVKNTPDVRHAQHNPRHGLTHVHLRSLCFNSVGSMDHNAAAAHAGEQAITLLEYLTLPNLRNLEIGSTYGREVFSGTSRFLTRSKCALDRLVIREPVLDAAALLECLQLTPNLVELDILIRFRLLHEVFPSPIKPFHDILRGLTVNPELESLCPKLRNILVGDLHFLDIPILLGFLRSRSTPSSGISQLEHVSMGFSCNLKEREYAQIRALSGGVLKQNIYAPQPMVRDPWRGLPEGCRGHT